MNDARTPTQPAAPGFLAALAALARLDDFKVEIHADEGSLQVVVRADGREPLEASGPAAALDAQLPAAVERYVQWINAEFEKFEPVQIDLPGSTAKAPRAPAKPAPKKPAAPKKAKKPAPPKRAAPRRTPAPRKPAPAAAGAKPDKAACIADYKAMKAKHGDKLTRRLFVDKGATGRRYESLWANSWPAFVKEAEGTKGAASVGLPGATSGKPAAAPKPKKAAPAAPKKDAPKDEPKGPWSVKLGKKKLGETIFEKKPGDTYTCTAGTFVVQLVDAEKREIHVAEPAAAPSELPPVIKETPPPSDTTDKDSADAASTTTTQEEPK